MRNHVLAALSALALSFPCAARPPQPAAAEWGVDLVGNASSGDFAPYFIGSNNYALTPGKAQALTVARIFRSMSDSTRWDFGYGAELSGGYSSSNDYMRYDEPSQTWSSHGIRPSAVQLRQLYGEARYRSLFITVGLKQWSSPVVNTELALGDFIEGCNARPVPQVRIGFNDFQDIPYTKHFLQVEGVVAFGKFTDNDYYTDHFNYYDGHICLGSYYHYKRLYFRTRPSERFSLTFGAQSASQFGGTTYMYSRGKLWKTEPHKKDFKTVMEVLFPPLGYGGEAYFTGNTLGSFDFRARYRLRGGDEIIGYLLWPWEDGSGCGKLNGWDGVWGLEWRPRNRSGIVTGAVIEYLDFRNQGGPIHWAIHDHPGTSLQVEASGNDDYYNNVTYNSYINYGMSMGTPFLMSPYYNTDGLLSFMHNRAQGVHAAVMGCLTQTLGYKAKFSYEKAWGSGYVPTSHSLHCVSVMAEADYDAARLLDGLSLKAVVALDRGTLRGNNFGAMLTVSYKGNLKF